MLSRSEEWEVEEGKCWICGALDEKRERRVERERGRERDKGRERACFRCTDYGMSLSVRGKPTSERASQYV